MTRSFAKDLADPRARRFAVKLSKTNITKKNPKKKNKIYNNIFVILVLAIYSLEFVIWFLVLIPNIQISKSQNQKSHYMLE